MSISIRRKPWQPANKFPEIVPPKGFRLRHCAKVEDNLWKKQQEGWVYLNSLDMGHKVDAPSEFRETVLMALPEDLARERDMYFEEINRKQTSVTAAQRARQALNMDIVNEVENG